MNLSAYDIINEKVDKQKTWINPRTKTLYSREFNRRDYYILAKRFNIQTNDYSYYLILLDDYNNDRNRKRTIVDSFGRIKVKLHTIWNDTSLVDMSKDSNINVEHTEHTDDGDIYYLDI